MRQRIDAFLRGLPQSTDDWSCPWFRWVIAVSGLALLAALAADRRVQDVTIVLPSAVLFLVLGMRSSYDGESCGA